MVVHAIGGKLIKIGETKSSRFDIHGGRKGEGEGRDDLPAAEMEGGNDMQARYWQELGEGAKGRRIVTKGEEIEGEEHGSRGE